MGRKTKYNDYFGNRFDDLSATVRKFRKKNNRAAMAFGLVFGLSLFAGAGYLVFSGNTSEAEIEQSFQTQAPAEQEIVQNDFQTPALTEAPVTAKVEQIKKLVTPKKKFAKNNKSKKALKAKKTAKNARIKKASAKQNLICINPAQLKTLKKNKVASTKRR